MSTRIEFSNLARSGLPFFLALLLIACVGDLPEQSTSTPEPAQGTIPAGTYSATFTAADNIRVGSELMTGTSSITFTDLGDFTISAPRVVLRGQYTVTEDQVKFDEINPSFPCENESVYVYRFKLEGDQLSFTTVEDACPLRVLAMTLHPYVKTD